MSGRAAFFTDPLGTLVYASLADADFPKANATTDRPGETFCHPTDSSLYPYGGQFDVSSSNQWVDTSLGNVSLTVGNRTLAEMLADLTTALQTLHASFSVTYSPSARKFIITRTGAFSLLWSSGAHAGSNIGDEIGFDVSADDTGSSTYLADEVRTATHTWMAFDASTATAAQLAVALLDAGSSGDYSDVKLYAMASLPSPQTRSKFASVATGSYSFSTRSSNPDAEIQAAIPAGAVSARWWVVSWRHIDAAQ